ncbi:hypothetical protein WS87_31405 [Burkholderia sp. MSMB0856]|uniref:hypothetical protein n=1 Tax=Burkholderia sp. MSMB0856 TaxID=1637869 RepID=UPI0007598B5C|nr:hypothetical protein [Burkholderia sp. MSMB0856]AOJ91229.1 hypothetical protein WS87_31405 [Burkholderia sp. MSMB0856]KVH28044.1 hypothetical protein WS87_29500 [Burkholderia sp. MSMB0856]
MRFGRCVAVVGLCSALTTIAHAGPETSHTVVKQVKLVAHIGDSLFVTKLDRTAYGVVELTAIGSSGPALTATVPIHIRTTDPDVRVTLQQPLRLSNGRGDLANAKVELMGKSGDVEIVANAGRVLTLEKPACDGFGGFDEVRQVKITAKVLAISEASPANASYRGDMVLIFEPTASAGRELVPGTIVTAGE